jgi:hypothetical protein
MVLEFNLLLEKQNEFIHSTAKGFRQEILTIIKSFEGSTVRQTNNQFLVSFKSVSNAVHAATNIQAALKIIKAQIKNANIKLKIGLTAGVPVTEKQLLFEETIKLAERMCEISKGEIIVTAEVEDLYKSENSNEFITGQNIHTVSPADEMFLNQLMDYMELNWTDAGLKVEDFCKPVIASHSDVYTIAPVFRNLKDDQIKAIAKNGGVIHLNFYAGFLDSNFLPKAKEFFKRHKVEKDSLLKSGKDDWEANSILYAAHADEVAEIRPPLSVIFDHIDYIVRLVGEDYVGLGSDFDGINFAPNGLDDVTSYPVITKGLLERGYSKKAIIKILGRNFIRVFKANAVEK